MAATVLNSPRAVEMSVYVVRAFVKLRQVLASNVDLARKLEALEKSVAALDAGTKKQFEEVYRAIRALMARRRRSRGRSDLRRISPRIGEQPNLDIWPKIHNQVASESGS
ncbi:MAG: hypothetical protein ACRES3_07180 [Steroidobacteraceae bacterium]